VWKRDKGNARAAQDYKACRNALLAMRRKKKEMHYSQIIENSDNVGKDGGTFGGWQGRHFMVSQGLAQIQ